MSSRIRFILLVAFILLLSLSSSPVKAADFTVTTTLDNGDGTCDAVACTLRDAILAANANAGADTITLPAGTYTFAVGGADEDAGTTGDLDIDDDVAITGAGAGLTVIDAAGLDRVFHIRGGTVAISGVTIQGGNVTDSGGGIMIEVGGEVTLEDVRVSGNTAGITGGGIKAVGRLTVVDSTVANNSSVGSGGGLDADFPPFLDTPLVIRASTFSGNTAEAGGAIGSGTNTPLLIENSTLSGNNASGDGGALRTYGDFVTIIVSTITNNSADSDNDGSGNGGALHATEGNVAYKNSIIAGNQAQGTANDCAVGIGGFTSLGYNLFGTATGCTTDPNLTDQTVTPANVFASVIFPLGDNGGPTQTHLPRPGSSIIDAIPGEINGCGSDPLNDQRGIGRPQDGDNSGTHECDIGSVEAIALPNRPVLLQATSGASSTQILGRLSDMPSTTYDLTFYSTASCNASGPTAATTLIGTSSATTNAAGNVYFTADLQAAVSAGQFVTAVATHSGTNSAFGICAAAGPNNVSWPQALPLTLSGGSPALSGSSAHYIDRSGQSRWYRLSVQPNSELTVTLTGLPADYNLTVFRDIAAAYEASINSIPQLLELNAEFAPEAFSPEAFSPEAFSPEAFSPEAFSPEAFSPEAFSPLVFSPEAFSPEAFSPEAFSPEAFSPEAFSPEAFSPEAFSPEAFSPEAFSPEAFSPEAFSGAQSRSIIGVSAFPGLASEGLTLKTWNNSGDFYIRVSGRNGAFSLTAPFQLNVTLLSGVCSGVSPALPASSLSVTGDYDTLILTDLSRMAGTTAEKAALQNKLNALALRSEVKGTVINVGADQRVAAANMQANSHPGCPYAKNLVAEAIEDIIDNYWNQHASLKYLVLVGNDDVIPFFRYPDQALLAPEQNYHPPVLDSSASQASLRLSYVLSQDRYGSRIELSQGAYTLPVTELAVGRLVETPVEIGTVVDAYLATNGGVVPTPASALVTGYDFLWDAADAVRAELEAGLGTAPINTLLNTADVAPTSPDAWTAAQLQSALLGARHDLIFLAGHFSASGALAADYRTRLSATQVANSTVNLTNAIIFSAGCHSGYNVVNHHAVPSVTEQPDWAQAFAKKGATFIGGTGYQYGDTDFIEYSERLYLNFAQQLRYGTGPVAVGQALTAAKVDYLANTPTMRGIHEKSLLQATLFGLPMLKVNLPSGRGTPASDPSIVTNTSDFTSDPGYTLGLQSADITLTPSLTEETVTLDNIKENTTVLATYWTGGSGVVTNPAEPALPLEGRNVSVPETVLRGVGFRGGTFAEQEILPLTGAPTTEIRGVHAPFLSSVFYPLRPWRVNYYDALADPAGGTTRLFVTPVQHRSSETTAGLSTARKFSSMDFRLYYSNYIDVAADGHEPALAAPPTIVEVRSEVESTAVHFSVRVVGDPAAGIQQVWVTYTAESGPFAGQWQSLDLTQNLTDSTLWEGTLPLNGTFAGDIRYMVQAVNGLGLVNMATNLGAFFTPDAEPSAVPDPGAPQPGATTLTLTSPPSSGAYGSSVPVQTRLQDGDGNGIAGLPITFILGAQQRTTLTDADGYARVDLPLSIVPGTYTLKVSFAGNEAYAPFTTSTSFTVNKQSTTLSLSPTQAQVSPGAPVNMVATLQDGLGRPLREKAVFFVVSTGTSVQYTTAVTTDYAGRAVLLSVPLPLGNTYQVKAYFGGTIPLPNTGSLVLSDPLYQSSTTSGSLVINTAPRCDLASPSQATLWPPDHNYRAISVLGVSDPDGQAVTLTVNSIFQDEAVNAPGSGKTAPDGRIRGSIADVRSERVEYSNGRVYHITFTAKDPFGASCEGKVLVGVPVINGGPVIDEGPLFNSTVRP